MKNNHIKSFVNKADILLKNLLYEENKKLRELDIEISEIKNIKKARVSISLNRGIYGIIGNNGIGKSTIMMCLAQAVFSHSLDALREEDIREESYVLLNDGKKQQNGFIKIIHGKP